MAPGDTTHYLQNCLDRLRIGDVAAREDLLRRSQERLLTLTRRMLAGFPHVKRFEQTDDVLQNVFLRLAKMLDQMAVVSVGDYLRLAATNIRRELIDLARHYYGPRGLGANLVQLAPGMLEDFPRAMVEHSPAKGRTRALTLADWTEFHEQVAQLQEEDREVFDLLWYEGLTRDEVAALLGLSLSTVKRRWLSARLNLMNALGGKSLS
jgi:RNA polymerase sigma factor (sigma-70 family)